MLIGLSLANQAFESYDRHLQEITEIPEVEKVFGKFDKDGDGIVTVREHVRAIRHKDLGGRVWSKIDMESPPELNPYEFHLATKNFFKKVCQEPEMINLYTPFDEESYVPFGQQNGGKRGWTLEEL